MIKIIGINRGSKDFISEVYAKYNKDGSMEIYEINIWNQEIELSRSEYRVSGRGGMVDTQDLKS